MKHLPHKNKGIAVYNVGVSGRDAPFIVEMPLSTRLAESGKEAAAKYETER